MAFPAKLALADGTVFTGEGFGAQGEVFGEVVFNTSMTGYQEILTDPSYHGQIVAIGAGVGLLLGFIIAGAREMKDTSLKNLKDVRAYTQMAVLGSIPLLENTLLVRRKRRMAYLAWSAAIIVGMLAISASLYYHYTSAV